MKSELNAKMESAMLIDPSSLISPESVQASEGDPGVNSSVRIQIGSPMSNPPSSLASPRRNCIAVFVDERIASSVILVPDR